MENKTYNNCEWFDSLKKCPNSKEPLMIQFTLDMRVDEEGAAHKLMDDSKGPEINEKFCNDCDSFLAITKP